MVLAVLILLLILLPAAYAGILAAPWVPTWQKDVKRILNLISKKRNLTFVELGCGSGTVILGVARKLGPTSPFGLRGVKVIGYEIQPILFLICWLKIKLKHINNAEVRLGNFFRADLSRADVVFLYWTEKTTEKIYDLRFKSGARVISYAFEIPGWKAVEVSEEKGRLPIFVYILR